MTLILLGIFFSLTLLSLMYRPQFLDVKKIKKCIKSLCFFLQLHILCFPLFLPSGWSALLHSYSIGCISLITRELGKFLYFLWSQLSLISSGYSLTPPDGGRSTLTLQILKEQKGLQKQQGQKQLLRIAISWFRTEHSGNTAYVLATLHFLLR